MSKIKADFIASLQTSAQPISPYEISQEIRREFSWVCLSQFDEDLNPEIARGYMIRPLMRRVHTPDDPCLYWCVISTQQSKGWQHVTWIKEMLHALDSGDSLTSNKDKLGSMLDVRVANSPNGRETPPHVVADKTGLILALGTAIPNSFRKKLRTHGQTKDELPLNILADLANIPENFIDTILNDNFEEKFNTALTEIENR